MRIYFMGICGTAMGNVALLMKQQGHEVFGADQGIYPPMSDLLLKSGITLFEGYDSKRLEELHLDKIVVGNVISRGNPELEWLLETRAIPYYSLPQSIQSELLSKRYNIVIAGTHGKTTTTTITAYLLQQAGIDAGYLIGGVPLCLPHGAHLGQHDAPFVIEGDEYDSAFFDKRSKFIHYLPSILVLNNIEFDHADIFRDLEDVLRSFSHVTRLVPKNGYILINGDDPTINKLAPIDWTNVIRVGESEGNDLLLSDYKDNTHSSSFTLYWKDKKWTSVTWPMSVMYNARNAAMAALSAGLSIYPQDPTQFSLSSLSVFKGIKRRQETLLIQDNLLVIEDFAHHPTAIQGTLQALKSCYPEHEIIACFEPRSNTACRRFHQDTFLKALNLAHCAYIGPIYRPHLYPASDRLDTNQLASDLKAAGTHALAYDCNKKLLSGLLSYLSPLFLDKKYLVCFLSNGSFDGIITSFVKHHSATLEPNLSEKCLTI